MVDLSTPNEWQHICPDTGLVMPWYTKPALDEIVTWDLKGKLVWEYGCGASTLWWTKKAGRAYGVDSSSEYVIAVRRALQKDLSPGWLKYVDEKELYANCPRLLQIYFDIIIVDGSPESWRDDCIKVALEFLKPGGALIIDNWQQPSVWMASEKTQKLLLAYPHMIFKEPSHPDWQTLIVRKQREITDIKITEVSLLENGQHGIGYTHKHTD